MTPTEFLATCTATKKEKEMEEKAKATEAVSRKERKNKRKGFFLALAVVGMQGVRSSRWLELGVYKGPVAGREAPTVADSQPLPKEDFKKQRLYHGFEQGEFP